MNVFKNKYVDILISLLRIWLGLWFLQHGVVKFLFKPDIWPVLGDSMKYLGIGFLPEFWGFMAVMTFVVGGLFLAIGLYSRFAAGLLSFTMLIAFIMHMAKGHSIMQMSLLYLVLLAVLIIANGGSFTLQNLFKK